VSADCGNIAGGLLCRSMVRTGFDLLTARKISLAVCMTLMAAAIPAVFVANFQASMAWVSLATFGYTGSLANMLALPGDFFPPNVLGSIWGLASMGSGLGGIFFTLLVGWTVERFAYVPVFIGFGLMPLLALGILILITTRKQLQHASE
jgi:MFS transporter, ACS family, hexuronate transporter